MIFSRKNIALTLASTMFFSVLISGKSIADEYKVREFKEILGINRVETSIKTSSLVKSDVAVIVSAYNYADALSSYNLVKSNKAKLILVSNEKDVEKVLKGLKLSKVFIIGGESVVGKDIENKVKEFCGDTTRISGKDRYETNNKTLDVAKFTEVGVADGRNFPDALVAGGLLNNKGYGLKLVKGNEPYTSDQKVVYTFGGKQSVNQDGGKRLSGSNRYITADMINKEIGKINTTAITDGTDYPDSLSALNILNLENNAAIIISNKGQLTKTAKENILNTKEGNNYIIGGSVGKERVYQSLSNGIIEKELCVTKDEGGRGTSSYRSSTKKETEDEKFKKLIEERKKLEEKYNREIGKYKKPYEEKKKNYKKNGCYIIEVMPWREKDKDYMENTFKDKYPIDYYIKNTTPFSRITLIYDKVPTVDEVLKEIKRVYGPNARIDITQEKLDNMEFIKPGDEKDTMYFDKNISMKLRVICDEEGFNLYKSKIHVFTKDEFRDLTFKVLMDYKNIDYYIDNVWTYYAQPTYEEMIDGVPINNIYRLPLDIEEVHDGRNDDGRFIDKDFVKFAGKISIESHSNLIDEQYDKAKFIKEVDEYKKIINNATNDSMTDTEKVYAVAKYLSKYYTKGSDNRMYPLTGEDSLRSKYRHLNYHSVFNNIMFYMNNLSYANMKSIRVYADGKWIDMDFEKVYWAINTKLKVNELEKYKSFRDIPDDFFTGRGYDKDTYSAYEKSEYQQVLDADRAVLKAYGKYFGY